MLQFKKSLVDDIALIQMDDGKANTITGEFIGLFSELLGDVQKQRAMVLMGNKGVFSAGFDLREIHALDEGDLQNFIWGFDELLLNLMTLTIPTVAAINGHAVAGGLLLAFACDYRLAANGSYKVGLNELELGIPLPMVGHEVARRSIPRHEFFQVVALGQLEDPATAEVMGVVQELTSTLVDDALEVARRLSRSPGAFALLKSHALRPSLERIRAEREEVNGDFITAWFQPEARERRIKALAKLEKNRPG